MEVIQLTEWPMKSLYIIGAGGFGREVLSWLRSSSDWETIWTFKGFYDDNPNALDGSGLDEEVLSLNSVSISPEILFVCAIGDPSTRLKICRNLASQGAEFYTLVHSSAVIGDNSLLGQGCILCPGALMTANVRIGNFVILNAHSSVGHDAVLGDGVTLSGHVDITGYAQVGEGAFFGTHATVLPKSWIGDFAIVGAGSVVLRSVKPGATVMGVPARQISP